MRKTIWKFQFDVSRRVSLMMPAGAKLLHVQKQNGVPCVWAIVDPDAAVVERWLVVRGTGHPVAEDIPYIGTILSGAFVWHVFDKGEVSG
jgi:hypothetical protein